jgi:hypothetical protein
MKNVYKIFVKTEENITPGRCRHRWEDNIRMVKVKLPLCHVKEISWEGVDWIHLAQDRD